MTPRAAKNHTERRPSGSFPGHWTDRLLTHFINFDIDPESKGSISPLPRPFVHLHGPLRTVIGTIVKANTSTCLSARGCTDFVSSRQFRTIPTHRSGLVSVLCSTDYLLLVHRPDSARLFPSSLSSVLTQSSRRHSSRRAFTSTDNGSLHISPQDLTSPYRPVCPGLYISEFQFPSTLKTGTGVKHRAEVER